MPILKKFSSASFRLFVATVFLATQLLTPLLFVNTANAAPGDLTAGSHEGQLSPSGTYTTGAVGSYNDGDSINFRFDIDASVAGSGQMAVEFTEQGNNCSFFDGTFSLGTHDASNPSIVSNSGVTPTVTTNGTPTSDGTDYTQLLDVSFTGTGNATVYYYLTLSGTASDCSGASQRSTLANSQTPGDFGNMGRHSVPIQAPESNDEPATITATKYIDEDGDNQADRTAGQGEWFFSLNGGTPVPTDANGQVIFEVNDSGDYTVSESIPDGYQYVSSRGTNCTPTRPAGTMTASVVVSPNGNQNAECTFLNQVVQQRTATVLAYKVVCSDEQYLPNWSGGQPGSQNGTKPNQITASTAQDFINQSDGQCRFTDGWDFQWGFHSANGNSGVDKAAGDFVGPLPTGPNYGDWKNFDTTSSGSNPASVQIADLEDADRLWVREVLQENYVPFVNPPGPLRSDNISAEIYCHTDILNYDNFDRVDNVELGGTYVCVAFNAPDRGSLTVEKQSQPQDPQDFRFRVQNNNGFDEVFRLDDDGNENNPFASERTFADLQPGTYRITEFNVDGWNLAGVRCNDQQMDIDNNTVWVNVVAGEGIRCIFTNRQDGSLTVTKDAIPNDNQIFRYRVEGNNNVRNFTLDDNPNSPRPSSRTAEVAPGEFVITEAREDGWIIYDIDCGDAPFERSGNSVRVRVRPGQDVECIFTNVKRGSITIIKEARPESDQQFNFRIGRGDDHKNFSLVDDGDDGNVEVFENVRPGNYWVREQVPEGWELRRVVCNTDFEQTNSRINFRLEPGGAVVCEFRNQGFGRITIAKYAFPHGSEQTFDFVGSREDRDKKIKFTLDGNHNPFDGHENRKTFDHVRAGQLQFREKKTEGWDLDYIYCYERNIRDFRGDQQVTLLSNYYGGKVNYETDGNRLWVDLEPGQDVLCRFINVERGDVKVTKFHDENQNGRFDEGEETLPGWEINLESKKRRNNNKKDDIVLDRLQTSTGQSLVTDEINGDDYERRGRTQTQTTGEDGMTTFEDVKPFPRSHKVTENLQEGWNTSNIYCERPHIYDDDDDRDNPNVFFQGDLRQRHRGDSDSAYAFVLPGKTTECFVGNYPDPELLIEKSNDKPEPTVIGDTVVYTIVVTNPEDSSCVFGYPVDPNCSTIEEEEVELIKLFAEEEVEEEEGYSAATVTDLPPSGFTYVPGSYTANSNVRGDLKAQGITTEPGYASPGTWNLTSALSNFIVPGEIITLTYQAVIENVVSDGTHDDSAFAEAFNSEGSEVYANQSTGNPFVGSAVTVETPLESQGFVLGTQTLARTGFPAFVQIGLGMSIAGAALLTTNGNRLKKLFKRAAKPLAGFLVAFGMILALANPAAALDAWTMNVIQPPTATNSSTFNLSYQVATIDDSNTFAVTLSEGGSALTTQNISTPFGDSRAFPVTFPSEGTFTYDVTATVSSGANAGESMSQSVTITYDESTPDSPEYLGKVQNGNTWTVSFLVPSGSNVETVQIFASTSSTFTADSTTRVGEVAATPGSQQSFTYTAPDGAERFFAIRTIDSAMNPSALVGDEEVVVTTVPGQTPGTTTAAGTAGSETTDGEVQGEGDQNEGGVTGELDPNQEDNDGSSTNPAIWIILAVFAALVAGALYWQSREGSDEE